MIYVCVPVHNEAKTAGLVLWKVRQVFSAFPREYQLLVLDDASTDGTGELLEERGGSRALRLARRWAPRLLRLPGLHDTISGFVALRLIVLRQALRAEQSAAPPTPLLTTDGWCANA